MAREYTRICGTALDLLWRSRDFCCRNGGLARDSTTRLWSAPPVTARLHCDIKVMIM